MSSIFQQQQQNFVENKCERMSCVQNSAMIKDELKIQDDLKDICKENIIIDNIQTTTIEAEFRKENNTIQYNSFIL